MSESMQAYYAARASEYDAVYLKPERQADLRAIEAWLPARFEGARVLEVACGTGYWTRFIAPAAASVQGIDAAPQTLRIAEARLAEARRGRAKVRFSSAMPMRLRRASRDATPPSPDSGSRTSRKRGFGEFLAGLRAVLAPGAQIVLIDNLFVAGSSTPIGESDGEGNTYQARRLDDGSAHRVLKNFPSEAELRAAAEGIGTAVEYKAWSYYWALTCRTRTP